MAQPELEQFFSHFEQGFRTNSFERLVLSKYQGEETELERITIRPVLIKSELLLSFLYQYKTNHITKNLTLENAILFLESSLANHFKNAHMLSSEWEIQLSVSKKGTLLLNKHRKKK
ncbi:MAG: hypothetical protein ABW044_01295 [Cellvibrio sp.]